MKYVKLAFLSIVDKLKLNLIIVLQLIAVFITVNILIGSVNNRSMLYEPYRDILDKHGWYVNYFAPWLPDDQGEASISGEPEVVRIYQTFVNIYGYDCSAKISIVPDEIFSNFRLPVTNSVYNPNYRLMVFPNKTGLKAGDEITLQYWENPDIENVVVTDILTNPTYYPSFSTWNIDGDISMLYKNISTDSENEAIYMITSVSGAEKIGLYEEEWNADPFFIMYYPDEVDESVYQAQQKFFDSDSGWNCIPLSVINERTQAKLKEDYYKYVPLGIITAIVVVIGTAGAIAVQTLKEMKNYAIYYLCGLKWRRMVHINLAKVLMLLLVSIVLSSAALIVFQSSNVAAQMGIAFNRYNIYASLVLAGLLMISSVAMPFLLFRRNQPAEVIRRMKND